MVIGLSFMALEVPSRRIALPLDVTRIVSCTGMPNTLPCQEPARVFIFSKAFCASDCGLDGFGIGICICCGNATAAVATRMIRIVSFRIGSPFEWFVELQRYTVMLSER